MARVAAPEATISAATSDEERVACDHEDQCGGCPLIGLSYPRQLVVKRDRLGRALAHYPALERVATSPVAGASPIVGYRTRAKLMFGPGGRLGLFGKDGGHDVVDIPHCRVLPPSFGPVTAFAREAAASDGTFAPKDGARPTVGTLRALDLREVRGDGPPGILVTLVIEGASADLASLRERAQALMRAVPAVLGVAANFHEGGTPQVLGAKTEPLVGAISARDRIGAPYHLATFGSFVQAHRDQAARIHALIAESWGLAARAAGPTPRPKPPPMRVLDLYGGSGAIALGLARAGARVHMVESFAPAAAQASEAARAQGLDLETECADVADALRRIAARRERFDAAVVNPPRRGVVAAAREALARVGAPQIAYVSCDPETLARDLDHFACLGYRAAWLRPFDMIPLTDEVETVALLRRGGAQTPRVIWECESALAVEKSGYEPTMPQGEYLSSLLARARLLPGAEQAVPVHRPDVGTSGLVLLARQPALAAEWSRVLSSPRAEKVFLAAVRGVTASEGVLTRALGESRRADAPITRYRRVAVASGHSILRVVLGDEGRHQIRRHLAAAGHPLLGDNRYGHRPTNRHFEEKNALDRPFLHCAGLRFKDPRTGALRMLESPLAGDLQVVLDRLGAPPLPALG